MLAKDAERRKQRYEDEGHWINPVGMESTSVQKDDNMETCAV